MSPRKFEVNDKPLPACPFCGHAHITVYKGNGGNKAKCMECGAIAPIDAWCKRAIAENTVKFFDTIMEFINNPKFSEVTDADRTEFLEANEVDYEKLATWCKSRRGQVIVCENKGANWLPFRDFKCIKATPGKHRKSTSAEVIYTKGCDEH